MKEPADKHNVQLETGMSFEEVHVSSACLVLSEAQETGLYIKILPSLPPPLSASPYMHETPSSTIP
jgi:hypothetical protein